MMLTIIEEELLRKKWTGDTDIFGMPIAVTDEDIVIFQREGHGCGERVPKQEPTPERDQPTDEVHRLLSTIQRPQEGDERILRALQDRFMSSLSEQIDPIQRPTPEEEERLDQILHEGYLARVRQQRLERRRLKAAVGKREFVRQRRRGDVYPLG